MPLNPAPRNVLFVAPSAYPLGGIATWLDYILPGLRERGWNVTLGLGEGRFHNVDEYLNSHPDDHVLRISYGTGTQEGRIRRLVQALHRARCDIVVSVNIADVAAAVDRIRALSKWSPRVAIALHALQPDLVGSIRVCAEVLDAVICTNRLACELVARSAHIASDRIYYAPYGVEACDTPSIKQGESDEILRIAHVGRLERRQKRIEDIADIVAELDNRGFAYELVIAGSGPDEQWLQAQLSNASGSGRIRFLGALTGRDLVEQVYRHAHALLITSHWETGPIVAWEAMANGVTVVTSAYIGSGLENSLEPGHNCLVFPVGDTVAAVDCLEKLRDGSLRNRILRKGLDLVTGRYSTTASIEQWSRSLEAIAAKCPLKRSCGLAERTQSSPAGRLDRLLGRQVGETVRGLVGLKYNHREPGGEWPHASPSSARDDEAFWQMAMSLDRPLERFVPNS